MARKRVPSAPEPPSSAENPPAAIDRLPIRQRAFVKALVSPDSPTYGQQGPSYQAVYKTSSNLVANVKACESVARGNTALAIREEIERQGLGAQVRIGSIREIIHGRHRAKSRTQSRKLEDGTVETTTETSPRAQDVLKAVQLLDKLDGTDSARQAEAKVREETLRALTRRIMATMVGKGTKDAVVRQEEGTEGTPQGTEGTGEGGGQGDGLVSPITSLPGER